MPKAIPDRWIPYSPCGRIIEGTRIICFKVPLNANLQAMIAKKSEIWDVKAVVERIPKLIGVIDLTFTFRYYSPQEFEAAGVRHIKILIPGREIPTEEKVEEFMKAVDELLATSKDGVLGVHCTHGLNRTGYLVCRFMRDRLHIPAKEAIQRFETARGYRIERKNYIANLLGEESLPADYADDTVIQELNVGPEDASEKIARKRNISSSSSQGKKERWRKRARDSNESEKNVYGYTLRKATEYKSGQMLNGDRKRNTYGRPNSSSGKKPKTTEKYRGYDYRFDY